MPSDSPSSVGAAECPNCGAALPTQAPQGLCPKCLFAGLAVPTEDGGDAVAQLPAQTAEELAPHFPQLEILECLGRGGMGVVYKARQKLLNRFIALKLLAPERVADAKFAQRFRHEAQALAALNHPNIVTIYDFGQAGGFYFLLMEFVDGVNLRQAMKASRFTPEQALAVVPPVCEALQYAHQHGIVHRDIKPENLLLDKEGRVKIADFGIAKMLGADATTASPDQPPSGSSDQAGTLASGAGTPQYMAPEQKEHRRTDHRADIYSMGVVLYEMLTGEQPKAKFVPPSKRVQVDIRIDEIVLRALEKEPELRFATAEEFRTQVEVVRLSALPSSRWSPLKWAAVILAGFTMAGLAYTRISEPGQKPPAPQDSDVFKLPNASSPGAPGHAERGSAGEAKRSGSTPSAQAEFERIKALEKLGQVSKRDIIKVATLLELAGASGKSDRGGAVDATRLGQAAHAQADAIARLSRLNYQAHCRYGAVDTLRAVDCTLETLGRALSEPVRDQDWIDYERGFSWDETRVIGEMRPGKFDLPFQFVFGTGADAWIRSETKDRSQVHFVRRAALAGLWNDPEHTLKSHFDLFGIGGYLRLTPHRFWWGSTVAGCQAHTLFFAKLDEVDWKSLGTEAFGDESCDLVDAIFQKGGDKAQRLWISQKTGLTRGVLSYFDDSKPNELVRFDDYREISPGVWLPFREVRAFPHSSAIKVGKSKLLRWETTVDEARIDRDLSARYAELLPKEGDQVQDQRFSTAVNLLHSPTRPDEEIYQLAENQRKEQLEGVEKVRRIVKPLEDMVGKPAPVLPAAGWLGGQRPEFAGKPCLIHFWATWCGPCKGDLPALRMLAGKGLTVIGLHPSGTPAREVEKFIHDQNLNYPTLLAAEEKDPALQLTLAGYPGGLFPYCVLVDATGHVASHGSLSDVNRAASTATFVAEMRAKPIPTLQASRWLNTRTPLALATLQGKVVLLDFWGQWCLPCVKNLPHCEELHTKFKDRGLVVIGVHTAHSTDELDAFLEEKKVTFPVMIDQGESAERFKVNAWPTYVLIDKAGKIVWGFTSEPPPPALIEALLAEK